MAGLARRASVPHSNDWLVFGRVSARARTQHEPNGLRSIREDRWRSRCGSMKQTWLLFTARKLEPRPSVVLRALSRAKKADVVKSLRVLTTSAYSSASPPELPGCLSTSHPNLMSVRHWSQSSDQHRLRATSIIPFATKYVSYCFDTSLCSANQNPMR